MPDREAILSGGNVTPVVRVGQTVRRAAGPWTPAVQALLRHLEARGYSGAPRALGYDATGREVLSFVAGDAGHEPLPPALWSDEALCAVARLIRAYHDASAGFVPPPDAAWQLVYPDAARHEVLCHNDLAPYNTVYDGASPVAFIDFDMAGPGPRAWDLAYAAYRFVPLEQTGGEDRQRLSPAVPDTQARRLRLFCDAYGIISPRDVLALVVPRIEQMCATITGAAATGNPAFQRMLAEGHLDHYRRELARLHDSLPSLIGGLSPA